MMDTIGRRRATPDNPLSWLTIPIIILCASFGPYLGHGIRCEHVVVYLLAPLAFLLLPFSASRQRLSSLYPFLVPLLAATAITVVASYHWKYDYVRTVKRIAHFENYVLPVCTVLVLTVLSRSLSQTQSCRGQLVTMARWFIGILVVHAVIQAASAVYDLSLYLAPFQESSVNEYGGSTAVSAASLGRYTGVFSHPAECGLAFSLGLLVWAWLRTQRGFDAIAFLQLLALFVGGLLTVSKIFLIGGVGLFLLWYANPKAWLRTANHRVVFAVGAMIVLIPTILVSGVFDHWKGVQQIHRFIERFSSDSRLSALSGNRFGRESTLVDLFSYTWEASPYIGRGFGVETTLDSAYAEFFVQGGVVGLAFYLAAVLWMCWRGWRTMSRDKQTGKLILFMGLLTLGGGFGMLIFTANRFGAMLTVFLACGILGTPAPTKANISATVRSRPKLQQRPPRVARQPMARPASLAQTQAIRN